MTFSNLAELRAGINPMTRDSIELMAAALRIMIDGDEAGWRTDHLGVPLTSQTTVRHRGTPLQMDVISVVVGGHIATHRTAAVVRGRDGRPTADWCAAIEGVDVDWPRPMRAEIGFPAHTLATFPIVVTIDLGPSLTISLTADEAHHDSVTALMASLIEQTRGDINPYRHRVLKLVQTQFELTFKPIPLPDPQTRLLSLPDEVWREIRLFTSAASSRRYVLRRAGFSTSRGLLLAGPPGCGKSHLIRVMLTDLLPTHTILIPDSDTIRDDIDDVYEMARTLGPIVVVLEDLDAVIGDRSSTPTSAHVSRLLNALDGVDALEDVLEDVLTIATANDPSLIDPAVTRTGRLDSHIFVPRPDLPHRAQIVASLANDLGLTVDATAVASALDDASGSDVREVVRRAVLEHGDSFGTAELLEIAHSGRWAAKPLTGNYL